MKIMCGSVYDDENLVKIKNRYRLKITKFGVYKFVKAANICGSWMFLLIIFCKMSKNSE